MIAVAAVVLLLTIFLSWCTFQDNRTAASFSRISKGMAMDQVRAILGAPSWDAQCGAKMPTGLPPDCVREFGYSATLAPLNPTYYLIWFGANGEVVETSLIDSPLARLPAFMNLYARRYTGGCNQWSRNLC